MKPKKSDQDTTQDQSHIPPTTKKLISMLMQFITDNNLVLLQESYHVPGSDEHRAIFIRYTAPEAPNVTGILDVITKACIQQYNPTYRTIVILIPKSQSTSGVTTQDFICDVNNIDEAYKILTDNILLGSI